MEINNVEENISNPEDKILEIIHPEEKKSKGSPWDSIKRNNILIMGIPAGEKRGRESIFNTIMDDNF